MNKLYNTQEQIARKIKKILLEVNPNIRKTQLKIIPYVVIGIILSESSVASDIAKHLKDDFSLVQLDSVIKRIKRLFKNKLFDHFMMMLLNMLYLNLNLNMKIKEFILHLIICFHIIITLFL